jgi:hypothetical protein
MSHRSVASSLYGTGSFGNTGVFPGIGAGFTGCVGVFGRVLGGGARESRSTASGLPNLNSSSARSYLGFQLLVSLCQTFTNVHTLPQELRLRGWLLMLGGRKR